MHDIHAGEKHSQQVAHLPHLPHLCSRFHFTGGLVLHLDTHSAASPLLAYALLPFWIPFWISWLSWLTQASNNVSNNASHYLRKEDLLLQVVRVFFQVYFHFLSPLIIHPQDLIRFPGVKRIKRRKMEEKRKKKILLFFFALHAFRDKFNLVVIKIV